MLRKWILPAATAPLAAGLVVLALILSQWPEADPRGPPDAAAVMEADAERLPPRVTYRARDGAALGYRIWRGAHPPDPGVTVIMLHGAGGHGGWMARLASGVAARAGVVVVAPDLRGHGPNPPQRGDVDHVGQLEEDLADLIAALGPHDRRIMLLGHSAGGGLAIRFGGGPHAGHVARLVLVAPFLQHDAPTARPPEPEGWARPLVRRIAGLWMLNAVGIEGLNHLTVVEFRFPPAALEGPALAFATRHYSYRLQFSLSPRRNWRREVAALPPFLLVVGSADATFRAEAYEQTLRPLAPQGEFLTLPGAGHADILADERLIAAVAEFVLRVP
jgi:alpha-beta hydrolase superfamily lysophospholipase